MKRLPDRRKLRRDYLWKAGQIYAKAIAAALLYVFIAGAVTITGLCLLYWMGIDMGHRQDDQPAWPIALFFLLVFSAAIWSQKRVEALVDQAKEQAEAAHVPPVDTANLPDEEVLLRGSETNISQNTEELLRPANGNKETPVNELLHPVTVDDAGSVNNRTPRR
jgi:hypothetical protein